MSTRLTQIVRQIAYFFSDILSGLAENNRTWLFVLAINAGCVGLWGCVCVSLNDGFIVGGVFTLVWKQRRQFGLCFYYVSHTNHNFLLK